MFKSIIKGKVFKIGDDIDTDQIYPGRYFYLTSPEEIALHAMEDIIPDFYAVTMPDYYYHKILNELPRSKLRGIRP